MKSLKFYDKRKVQRDFGEFIVTVVVHHITFTTFWTDVVFTILSYS